jgi:hypothetical protein
MDVFKRDHAHVVDDVFCTAGPFWVSPYAGQMFFVPFFAGQLINLGSLKLLLDENVDKLVGNRPDGSRSSTRCSLLGSILLNAAILCWTE